MPQHLTNMLRRNSRYHLRRFVAAECVIATSNRNAISHTQSCRAAEALARVFLRTMIGFADAFSGLIAQQPKYTPSGSKGLRVDGFADRGTQWEWRWMWWVKLWGYKGRSSLEASSKRLPLPK